MAVLEDLEDRVSYMALVPTKPDYELVDMLARLGDPTLISSLKQQWDFEERYTMLQNAGQHLGTVVLGKSSHEEVKEQLAQSTRTLTRQLRKNEKAREMLKRRSHEINVEVPSPRWFQLQGHLSELTAITLRRLTTTVEEETTNKKLLVELTEKERQAAEDATVLKQTLVAERDEREREVSALEQTLSKFHSELDNLTKTNRAKIDACRAQSEAQLAQAETEHQSKLSSMKATIADLEAKLESHSHENRDTEATLRKKKERVQAELTAHINKYKTDTDEFKRQISEIKTKMEAEEDELRVLEEHFAKVDADEKRRSEEEAILDAFKGRLAQAEEVLHKAASMIQKHVRGKQLRVFIKQLMGKKGRKGGKGKRKGKGKSKKK